MALDLRMAICYFVVTVPECHKPRNSLKVCGVSYIFLYFLLLFSVVIVMSNTSKLSLCKWCPEVHINLDKIQFNWTVLLLI